MVDTPKPGMIGIRNKKTKEVTYHFPVDVKEIAASNSGEFELVDDGSVESARLVAEPLKAALESSPAVIVVGGVSGVETVTEEGVKEEVKVEAEPAKPEPKPEPAKPVTEAKPAATEKK